MNNKVILSNGRSSSWPHTIVIYTDGASRGNPGLASFGLTVLDYEEEKIFEEAQTLGIATNNEAEYKGIQRALELAVQNNVKNLTIKTDSQLVVRQLKGEYKIKSPNLKLIHNQCSLLIQKIPQWDCLHVFRENNKRADELANLALDSAP